MPDILAKTIPPYLKNAKSGGEKIVFALAEEMKVSSDWVMLHSLNVPKHRYKPWSELDFVLVSSHGILVFEVKGGRVTCEDGIWRFQDRYGTYHRKSEGPFDQAKSGMYALRKMLEDMVRNCGAIMI